MDSDKIRKFLYMAFQALIIVLGLLIYTNMYNLDVTKKPDEEIKKILTKQHNVMVKTLQGRTVNDNIPDSWPPKMNEVYPDMVFMGLDSNEKTVGDFMGKVVVLEFIDMSSPISQAQSGAALTGPYGTMSMGDVDKSISTFPDILRRTTQNESLTFPNANAVHIKVLVYTQDGAQASLDDAQSWADHFDFKPEDGFVLLVPKDDVRGEEIQGLINGYQLIDEKGRLRVDSSGIAPKHNLQLTLMPLAEKLMR